MAIRKKDGKDLKEIGLIEFRPVGDGKNRNDQDAPTFLKERRATVLNTLKAGSRLPLDVTRTRSDTANLWMSH